MYREQAIEAIKAQLSSEGTTSDLISRQAALDALNKQIQQCRKALGSLSLSDVDKHAVEVKMASLRAYRKMLENLPTIQPETPCYLESPCEYQNRGVVISQPELAAGEWIVHLYKVGVNRYECDTCHARCDIMYPYCPYCGEKKEGERYAIN